MATKFVDLRVGHVLKFLAVAALIAFVWVCMVLGQVMLEVILFGVPKDILGTNNPAFEHLAVSFVMVFPTLVIAITPCVFIWQQFYPDAYSRRL